MMGGTFQNLYTQEAALEKLAIHWLDNVVMFDLFY